MKAPVVPVKWWDEIICCAEALDWLEAGDGVGRGNIN